MLNDCLMEKIQSLIIDNETYKNNEEDLCDRCEDFDTKSANLKELLKNFHKMYELKNRMYNTEKYMRETTRNYIIRTRNSAIHHQQRLYIIIIPIFIAFYQHFAFYDFILVFMLVMVLLSFHISSIDKFIVPKMTQELKNLQEIKDELNDIVLDNEYVVDLIEKQ